MSIFVRPFGATPDGRAVPLYTLETASGFSVSVTPFGCRIVSILAPDRNGHFASVLHSFDHLEPYWETRNFHGAFVGRFANRIGGASLDRQSAV